MENRVNIQRSEMSTVRRIGVDIAILGRSSFGDGGRYCRSFAVSVLQFQPCSRSIQVPHPRPRILHTAIYLWRYIYSDISIYFDLHWTPAGVSTQREQRREQGGSRSGRSMSMSELCMLIFLRPGLVHWLSSFDNFTC